MLRRTLWRPLANANGHIRTLPARRSLHKSPAKPIPEKNVQRAGLYDGLRSRLKSLRLLTHEEVLSRATRIVAYSFALYACGHLFFTYFYTYAATVGVSMCPTILPSDDWVVVSKLYRRGKRVKIGDVVSFAHPMEMGTHSVKRVVGLSGDWVCRDTPGVGRGFVIQVSKHLQYISC